MKKKSKLIKPNVVKTHPLAELLSKKLFGIESDCWHASYRRKEINNAIKAAVKWAEDNK